MRGAECRNQLTHQEGLVLQRLKRHLPAPAEGMSVRRHDEVRMITDQQALEIHVVWRPAGDRDVQRVLSQRPQNFVSVADRQLDLDFGVGARKAGDRERHEIFRRAHGAD